MKTLFFTDPHINENSIEELGTIFQEITQHDADRIIMGGDYYQKNSPSPSEILFGTQIAKKLVNTYKEVIFLRGNHDKIRNISAIDYLKFLGVKIVDEFVDEDDNLFAHIMLNESKMAYGSAKKGIKDLKKYNYVLLGHCHLYQEFNEKIYHPSSIRFCNFNETVDKFKRIVIIEDDKLNFIKLTNPIPMVDVTTIKELDQLPERTKVRIIINSFENYKKQVNKLSKYKEKFEVFKIKLDFSNIPQKKAKKKEKNTKEIITSFLKKVKDEEVRKELEEQFKQENQL